MPLTAPHYKRGDENSNFNNLIEFPSSALRTPPAYQTRSIGDAVEVTIFPDQFAKKKRQAPFTLQELANIILKEKAATKAKLPFVKYAKFSGDVNPDNPEAECLRCDANVMVITGVEGDKDKGPLSFEKAAELLEHTNVRALLYTSASHTEEAARFRVICPTSRDLPPGDRSKLIARVNGILGGALSPESYTLSQSYYFGSVNGKPLPLVRVIDGDCIDLRDDLDKKALAKGQRGPWSPTKAEASKTSEEVNNFYVEFGKAAFKPAVNVEQSLANMAIGNIHLTQLSLIAALLNRHVDVDEAVDRVLSRTMEVTEIHSERTRATQTKKLYGMAESWFRKHPELRPDDIGEIVGKAFVFVEDESTLTRYDFLLGHHLLRGEVAITAAVGGTGKSSPAIVEALSVASGQQLTHDRVSQEPLRVVLINLEDNRNTVEKRIQAAMKEHDLTQDNIGDRLITICKGEIKIKVAKKTRQGEIKRIDKTIDALAQYMIEQKADVLSIDSLIRSHSVSENVNEEMAEVIQCFEDIAQRANCAVHLWHHNRKSKDSNNTTVESVRGAGATIDAARSVRILETMTEKMAKDRKIANRRPLFRSFNGKLNFAPAFDSSDWCEIKSHPLMNGEGILRQADGGNGGDSMGVVTTWALPEAVEMDEDKINDIVAGLADCEGRKDVQAANCAGNVVARVLGLDPDDDRETIKQHLKHLLKTQRLKIVSLPAEDHKKRPFYVPSATLEAKVAEKQGGGHG